MNTNIPTKQMQTFTKGSILPPYFISLLFPFSISLALFISLTLSPLSRARHSFYFIFFFLCIFFFGYIVGVRIIAVVVVVFFPESSFDIMLLPSQKKAEPKKMNVCGCYVCVYGSGIHINIDQMHGQYTPFNVHWTDANRMRSMRW